MTPTAGDPIVVGVDFSPESRQALNAATALANKLGSPLHIISAIEPLLAEAALQANQLQPYFDRVRADLHSFAAAGPVDSKSLTCEAQIGDPAELLTTTADRLRARLIVVGSRGHGRAARMLLGSTTTRVLRLTNHSVLVTDWRDQPDPADATHSGRVATEIVCGVDFSDGSNAAVLEAVRLSRELNATLALVHASESSNSEASERLAAFAREHAPLADVRIRTGDAPEVLAKETDGRQGALIVVGLRGTAKVRPGKTAMAVLASASVPVIGVPS